MRTSAVVVATALVLLSALIAVRQRCMYHQPLFRLCTQDDMDAVARGACITGSAEEQAAGFLHLCTAEQCEVLLRAKSTSALHALRLNPRRLSSVKWEYSAKWNQHFPHLYASQLCAADFIL